MREFFLVILLGYIILLLDVTIFAAMQFSYLRIDGIMPLVIWYGFKRKSIEPILVVIILALIAGTFTYASTGIWIVSLCIGYLLSCYIYNQLDNLLWYQNILFFWFLITVMVVILMFGTDSTDLIWPYGIIESFILALLTPIWFYIFDLVSEFLFPQKR